MLTDVGVLAGVLDNACVLDNVGVLVCWRAVLAIVLCWRANLLTCSRDDLLACSRAISC